MKAGKEKRTGLGDCHIQQSCWVLMEILVQVPPKFCPSQALISMVSCLCSRAPGAAMAPVMAVASIRMVAVNCILNDLGRRDGLERFG